MRRITALLVGAAVLTAISTVANAEDGCGRGWYHNGRQCVPDDELGYDYPPPPPSPDYYPPPPAYYPPPPPPPPAYYLPPADYESPADRELQLRFDPDEARYSPPNPAFKTWNNCPPNFTVQDGLCKPYTGR
jgi:hypothetical protein